MKSDFWREVQRRDQERRAERRAEFFADRSDIPDLEFLTPECSVCGLATEFDDGSFSCVECCITWPRSGYGHESFRWDEPAAAPISEGGEG